MANITPCGSLFFDDTYFKVIDGVVTDATALTISNRVYSSCGLCFDSHYFKTLVDKNLSPNPFITLSGINSTTNLTGSPCSGTLFDASRFTLTGNVISYGDAIKSTLTFNVTPDDATIELTDNLGNAITLTNKVANVVFGRTYHYKVTKNGYQSNLGGVAIIQKNQTVTITLNTNP